jgi:hypothetical protein
VRKQATHERDFHPSHKAQAINAVLKPHEALRKMLLDQEADPRPRGNDVPTVGAPPPDRAPDEVQVVPASIIEHEAGQTIGMESIIGPADAAQTTALPGIERKGRLTTGSLEVPSLVMVMVVAALGVIKFLLRRSYAKRGLVRRLPKPTDYGRPLALSWLSRGNQVEADDDAILRSVKKALDTIAEAEAEMASSRQLRTSS